MSGGPDRWMDHIPDELLSRILVAAAPRQKDGSISLFVMGRNLPWVCKRWRGLCFSTEAFWENLSLVPPSFRFIGDGRQRWLERKLWLLQRIGSLVHHLEIWDDDAAPSLMQPLLQAAPCTLRSLHLRMRWGAHLDGLPQLLDLACERLTSLERLELSATVRLGGFDRAALRQQPVVTATQLEARLVDGMLAGIAALAGTLTELKLSVPAVELPTLAPLTALRRLRQLTVVSGWSYLQMRVPALAQFPCLEQFEVQGGLKIEAEEGAAGHTFTAASWSAAPAGTLRLEGVQVATLPALLAALRPPAAGPLECLLLEDAWPLESGFAAAVAAVEACAPHFQHLRELGIAASAYAAFFLMPLLRQLPRLESLQLTKCSLSDLPAGPYLSCLSSLSLAANWLHQLPPALLHASRLQTLSLHGNLLLQPAEPTLLQLLQALPDLRQLDLRNTSITKGAAAALEAAAAERGMTVQLPDIEPPEVQSSRWWSDEDEAGYYSSTSDSSDDGCPRYSWAGCAYASRW